MRRFYFSFQDADYLYMCMDLAPGGELLGLILHNRSENEEKGISKMACDEITTRFYTAELVEALMYLHSNEIYHRDLKPESKS
jgi:serine/threonine protein kinase